MMDMQDLLQYLPHRYPFLLVDRVTAIGPGDTIAGFKNLTMNEAFFTGHFPGHPIMPGVLMIEAMAQLSGVLAFKLKRRTPEDGYTYYLAGVDRTRYKRPVVPGDRLDMHCELLKDRRGVMKFSCEAHVEQTLACSSEILCVEKEL